MQTMNARPQIEISPKILERNVRKVFDAEVAARAEVRRIERLRKGNARFKEKGHVFAKKLATAHYDLGDILMHHIGQQVDTVRMFGDLFNDHRNDLSQVVPQIIQIIGERQVVPQLL